MANRPVRFHSTKSFDKAFRKLAGDNERTWIEAFLAANPTAGDVMPRIGGARKLRWRRPGIGKSGGIRVIYYFRDGNGHLWLLDVYAKSAKDNLTDAEANELNAIVKVLKAME